MNKNDAVNEIIKRLGAEYKDTTTALQYANPYELLVATILAAQCTDERVNKVTKTLFVRFPDPFTLSRGSISEIEEHIQSCGLYKNKAKNLLACAKRLTEEFGGLVPHTMEELVTLAGVGRKTASVVLAYAFGIPAMAVDTHVARVSNRLGLANSKNPVKIEQQLCALIPRDRWSEAHHWLIWHGRKVCHARKPDCARCCVLDVCPYFAQNEGAGK